MIVAGDIGGTKTYLGLFDWQETRVAPIREEKFWNTDFESFEEILEEFLQPPAPADALAEGDEEESEDTEIEEETVKISPTMPSRRPVSASPARLSTTAAAPRIFRGSSTVIP